jgi:pyrimidine-specific ribonucleoside hydrolase
MLLHVWGWNCILTSHTMRRMTRFPVLIDTDVDIDDWMAILYLSMHPDVDLRGVTTTGVGACHLTPGTRNALNLLQLTGKPDVPVAK